MTSTIKVDTIKDQASTNIVNKCGTTINIGAPGDTTKVAANTIRSNALQNACGGNTISKCGTAVTIGQSGDTVSLAAGASQSGFGRSGSVDWDTGSIKTGTFTASNGNGYFIDTSSNIVTCNLSAGTAGDIVSLADYKSTWATYNVTLVPNGTDKIGGTNANATLETSGQSVTLVYVDATQGWVTVLDSTAALEGGAFICATVSGACNTLTTVQTNYKVATFLGPGTFCVASGGGGKANVDYMVIGGGGGGGGGIGGGGGAGGVVSNHPDYGPRQSPAPSGGLPAATNYPVSIGEGGAGNNTDGQSPPQVGSKGGITSLNGLSGGDIDAYGGAGGGSGYSTGAGGPATGSGGGDGHVNNPTNPGVTGTPISPGTQGYTGGISFNPHQRGGGGGGAGGAGVGGGPTGSGDGGVGIQINITGNDWYWAGGGGGGKLTGTSLPAGDGGLGGGGGGSSQGGSAGGSGGGSAKNSGSSGSQSSGAAGGNGGANTGGGGGGAAHPAPGAGGTGGDGIVVVRYKFQ